MKPQILLQQKNFFYFFNLIPLVDILFEGEHSKIFMSLSQLKGGHISKSKKNTKEKFSWLRINILSKYCFFFRKSR